jgi:hypothetical protein
MNFAGTTLSNISADPQVWIISSSRLNRAIALGRPTLMDKVAVKKAFHGNISRLR